MKRSFYTAKISNTFIWSFSIGKNVEEENFDDDGNEDEIGVQNGSDGDIDEANQGNCNSFLKSGRI